MAKEIINIGSVADDHTGDPLRSAFQKAISNFDELYAQFTHIMTTSELDSYLIALAASANTTAETIDLLIHSTRSIASNAAMITLQGKNKTILVNEKLGKELVLNGDFSSVTGWSIISDVTISGGAASITAQYGAFSQNDVLHEKQYCFFRFKFKLTAVSNLTSLATTDGQFSLPTTLGNHSNLMDFSAGSQTGVSFTIYNAGGTCSIDDVSARIVGDKILTVIGDSIAADINSFGRLMQRENNYALCSYAVGGASIFYSAMDLQTVAAINDNADIIINELGTNDDETDNMSLKQTEIQNRLKIQKASNPNATIYYMNVLPRWTDVGGLTEAMKPNIRACIAAACLAENVTCWDTYTDPWINASDTIDGIHPSAAGHVKIRNRILALLP